MDVGLEQDFDLYMCELELKLGKRKCMIEMEFCEENVSSRKCFLLANSFQKLSNIND